MALGAGMGRMIAAPLLGLNFIFAVIILGLAGRVLDRNISNQFPGTGFEGNAATFFLVLFSLLAGVATIAAVIAGLHHMRLWRSSSGAAAQATSWVAWLLLVLAFCLAWKEIHLGGRGIKLRVLEAFVIMLTVTKFIYTLALYLGDRHDDVSGHHGGKLGNPNAPRAASAV